MDPVTDMLNRIWNAQAVFKDKVLIPFSKFKFEIAKLLAREGFVVSVGKRGRKERRMIEIWLKYEISETGKKEKGVIDGFRRISKPGQRIYSSAKEIIKNKKRKGLLVISTSKGVITAKEAKKENIGGEVLFEIW